MAMCDANYRFTYVDVYRAGRAGDAGVFRNCTLSDALDRNLLNIPQPEPIWNDLTSTPVPYHLLADNALPLRADIMKPFSAKQLKWEECVFNYRLSRGRRCIENAFGLLCCRFRCLLTALQLKPDNVTDVVLACCTLHNFLLAKQNIHRTVPNLLVHYNNYVEIRHWQEDETLRSMRGLPGNNTIKEGRTLRDFLTQYYNSKGGSVHWQDEAVERKYFTSHNYCILLLLPQIYELICIDVQCDRNEISNSNGNKCFSLCFKNFKI